MTDHPRIAMRWLLVSCMCAMLLLCGCMVDREKQIAENEKKLAAAGITALVPGDTAPGFTSTATDGSDFSLTDATGQHRVVLFFYPAGGTPNSTRDLLGLGRAMEQLGEHGIAVYGVSPATLSEDREAIERYSITIPLLSDPGLTIARDYGCAAENGRFPQRTVVGIDQEGKIAFFIRGTANAKQILDGFDIAENGSD